MTKRILTICGSLRPHSSNASILKLIGTMLPAHIMYSSYDQLGELPHFNPMLDTDLATAPAPVQEFRQQLRKADAVLICTPEYAFGVPGTLKNALDWTVSSAELVRKPVALITASTGGDKAHASLLMTLGALQSDLLPGAALLISFIRSKMDQQGNVTDPATLDAIRGVTQSLVAALS